MAYTDIDKSDDYFNTVLYTGNASSRSITGVNFQPDWVWIKRRSTGDAHYLFDNVRTATKYMSSNNTDAEVTNANTLTSFPTVNPSESNDKILKAFVTSALVSLENKFLLIPLTESVKVCQLAPFLCLIQLKSGWKFTPVID